MLQFTPKELLNNNYSPPAFLPADLITYILQHIISGMEYKWNTFQAVNSIIKICTIENTNDKVVTQFTTLFPRVIIGGINHEP